MPASAGPSSTRREAPRSPEQPAAFRGGAGQHLPARLRRLRGRQVEQQAIDGRFLDHERFVSEVMMIDPAPHLKLVAVLHREA